MPAPRYICVMNYRTGHMIYLGLSEWESARCLEPGTVFGTGSSESSARAHAMRRMAEQCADVTTQGVDRGI